MNPLAVVMNRGKWFYVQWHDSICCLLFARHAVVPWCYLVCCSTGFTEPLFPHRITAANEISQAPTTSNSDPHAGGWA